MRTDYLGLEAFVAIADLGSFRRAASFLNVSQTALSHRIKKLEADLGTELLIRTTREVSLTKEAQDILPSVRDNLKELSSAYSALAERQKTRKGILSFACLPTLAYNYLPRVLREFSSQYPEIVVHLEDRQVSRVYELVQSGEVEFGISVVGARHWDLDVEEIYSEPYVLFVHRDHPLAEQESVARADLAGLSFAQINTQSSNRKMVDDALGEHRDAIIWRYRVQNPAMALSLVAEGAAVTVLPALMANLAWQDLKALPFRDVEINRTLGLVTRRGDTLSVPGRHLVELLRRRMGALPAGPA